MAALRTKHSVVPRLKRQVLLSEVSFVKGKRSLLLELEDIYLQGMKSICRLILPNYELINPLMSDGKKKS